jgi:hypothetical protein
MKTNIENETKDKQTEKPRLVGVQTALCEVFQDERTRPSLRCFNEWKALGYYPWIRIGKRVFLDPDQVRKALIERFTIPAGGKFKP